MSTKTIVIINPNSSSTMTEQLARECEDLSDDRTKLSFLSNNAAPLSIEGFGDGIKAAAALTDKILELEASESKADAYVIACFDDTGVDAVRELTDAPVIGIGEAACIAASLLGQRYIVITTLARSVAIIEDNLSRVGVDKRCAKVYASGIPVLSLESDPQSYQRIVELAQSALTESRAEVLVLGCAGMASWVNDLQKDLGVPVIDGVRVAIKFAAGLQEIGLSTSKRLSYQRPERKQNREFTSSGVMG